MAGVDTDGKEKNSEKSMISFLSVWGLYLLSSFKWNFRKTQVSMCEEAPKKFSKRLKL